MSPYHTHPFYLSNTPHPSLTYYPCISPPHPTREIQIVVVSYEKFAKLSYPSVPLF
jgi:hypothetical protein